MTALFKTPKIPPPQPVKLPKPAAPPPVAASPADTNAPELAFLRSRRRKGSGLSGLILTPLGAGGSPTSPEAKKTTLGA